jgi:hypothetical protein
VEAKVATLVEAEVLLPMVMAGLISQLEVTMAAEAEVTIEVRVAVTQKMVLPGWLRFFTKI